LGKNLVQVSAAFDPHERDSFIAEPDLLSNHDWSAPDPIDQLYMLHEDDLSDRG
jgi:hypothetical protein